MESLSEEIVCEIFKWLGIVDLWRMRGISKTFYRISTDTTLWEKVTCDEYSPNKLLEHAAGNGNSTAALVLGMKLHLGNDENIFEAMKWYRISALKGNSEACYNLGCIFDKGIDGLIQRDAKLATFWLRSASHLGHSNAQNALGIQYEYGNGCDKSFEKALFWYQQSAQQGNSDACFNIGLLLFYGCDGLKRDMKLALKYFKMSYDHSGDNDSKVWYLKIKQLLSSEQ